VAFGSSNGAEVDKFEGLRLNGTDSDGIAQPTLQSKFARRQVLKLAVAGLGLSALLATAVYGTGFNTVSTAALKHDNILTKALDKELNELVGLDGELASPAPNAKFAKCEQLVVVKNPEVVTSNLGGVGPDKTAEEGITYNTEAYMQDGDGHKIAGKKLKVVIHAKGAYDHTEGHSQNFNGLHGKFLSILIKGGTSLNFNVSVVDADTNKPFLLPYFSITFFDIDMGKGGGAKEYVVAQKFSHYYVYKDTQIKVTDEGEGKTKFSASKVGTGADNPRESEALEPIAKSKGVTLSYLQRSSADFTIGAEGGSSADLRGFLFTLRPSMICAKTHLQNGDWVDPLDASITGVDLPLMDGDVSVPGMEVPIIHIAEDGTVIIVTDKGNNTIGNVADIIANENGTVTIEENNGKELLENGTLQVVNGADIIDARDKSKYGTRGEASAKSGAWALLIVVTLLAVVWPLSNIQ